MKKENILTYLEESLLKALGDTDFAIDWDNKNRTIEVIVALFAENKAEGMIEDESGVQTEEEYIEFEDSILFYEEGKSEPNPEDYLAVFPYDRKKGIAKGEIDAVANYLADVLVDGQDDLLDFLNDESIETFGLVWDEETLQTYKDKYTDSTTVPYPKF